VPVIEPRSPSPYLSLYTDCDTAALGIILMSLKYHILWKFVHPGRTYYTRTDNQTQQVFLKCPELRINEFKFFRVICFQESAKPLPRSWQGIRQIIPSVPHNSRGQSPYSPQQSSWWRQINSNTAYRFLCTIMILISRGVDVATSQIPEQFTWLTALHCAGIRLLNYATAGPGLKSISHNGDYQVT